MRQVVASGSRSGYSWRGLGTDDSMRSLQMLGTISRFRWWMLALAVCCRVLAQDAQPLPSVTPVAPGKAPVHLTAEQDRLRLLGLLGLKEADLRPAPVPDAKSPHGANYDEAKANVYP